MSPLIIFSHGMNARPWGTKIVHLAEVANRYGAQVLSPDHSKMLDSNERVKHLVSMPELSTPSGRAVILVGSSMGAYVSCVASQIIKPLGMFLLAPAFGIKELRLQYPEPGCQDVEIVMGWQDEIIPVQNIFDFGNKYHTRLHLLDADHRLTQVIPELQVLFDNFLRRTVGAISVE